MRAGVLVLLVAVLGFLTPNVALAAPDPAGSGAPGTGTVTARATQPDATDPDATEPDSDDADTGSAYQPPFDPAAVTAELLAAPVVELPGSIARFDQARLDALTGAGDVKVLVAPAGPLDSADNKKYRAVLADVTDAVEQQWDGTVVRIVGAEVQSVGQDSFDGVRHLLSTFDVTTGLEFIVPYLQDRGRGATTDERVVDRTDPALVADLTGRLRASGVVVTDEAVAADPLAAVADPDRVRQDWRDATGTTLRLVVLPPLADGEPAGVTAADLAPAFPDDAVVLVQGRWLDVAGPDGTAWRVARDMTLSRYGDFLESRQIGPVNTLLVLGKQYAELTSGAVEDQPTPTQRNPLTWLLLVLPWLALLLVVVFAVRHRARRRNARAATARHDDVAGLAEAAAALPTLADGILALDGLARTGPARDLLTEATTGYRSARRAVAARRDGAAAVDTVRRARASLTEAADLLGVPNVPGTLPRVEAVGR